MSYKLRSWLILVPAVLLLGLSVWLQPQQVQLSSQTWLTFRETFAIRQGLLGGLALALAFGIGNRLPPRQAIRLCWLPLALFGLLIVAAPLSLWADWGFSEKGTYWWQRSPGLVVALLALLGGMTLALPRYARCERFGAPALAGLLVFMLGVPLAFTNPLGTFIFLFGMLGLSLLTVVRGGKLWTVLPAVAVAFLGLFVVLFATKRNFLGRHFLPGHGPDLQLAQSLRSIQAGGLAGNGVALPPHISDGHTDFVFGNLCGRGGLVLAIFVLALTGVLLTLSWSIVARRNEPQARALAAGCAAALTLQALLHIAVNTGLCPLMPTHFPFLSYGPLLLLLDGFLLGLLLSLDREEAADAPAPSRWPTTLIQAGVAFLLALFAVRISLLVFATPCISRGHTAHAERRNLPVRGRILDAKGRVLAQTGEMLIACADPKLLATSDESSRIPEVARLIGMEEQVVRALVAANAGRRYARLKKNLEPETAEAIRRLKLQAFFIDTVPTRDYPFATPLAHVVGCAGSAEDYRGLSGVEVARNTLLTEGGDVRLTLDIDMQAAVQRIAETAATETHSRRTQIVVMDPRTGSLRAAAQVPALHGRGPSLHSLEILRWIATGEVFEPGGLLKPLVAAAALEKGAVTPESRIPCEGGVWTYKGFPLHDPSPQGELTPAEILQKGSNIGMAKIGLLLGEGPLHQALERWGLTAACSAGLGFGERGLLSSTNRWSKLEITRIPIGHGCAVTLLQLLRAYSALFNDGRMAEPTLIAATRTTAGADWLPAAAAEPTSVIRPETAAWLRATLKKELSNGLSVIGQPAIVQKTLTGESGYDPSRVVTAFIGGLDIAGAPHLIAVWLDTPERQPSDPNPAVGVFIKTLRQLAEKEVK